MGNERASGFANHLENVILFGGLAGGIFLFFLGRQVLASNEGPAFVLLAPLLLIVGAAGAFIKRGNWRWVFFAGNFAIVTLLGSAALTNLPLILFWPAGNMVAMVYFSLRQKAQDANEGENF